MKSNSELFQYLLNLLARDGGVVSEKHCLAWMLGGRKIWNNRFPERVRHDLLYIENRDELAVGQLGDRRDHTVAHNHIVGRLDLVPLDTDDAVDLMHQETLCAAVELGHHHGRAAADRWVIDIDELRQIDHRDDLPAQADDACHAAR